MSFLHSGWLHLLRPWWLLALLALPLLGWLWRRHARAETPWKRLVDPHLLSSLLQEAPPARSAGLWFFAAGYLLAVFALAGPAWRQPVALYAPRAPLVVVQDLSSHMLVADTPPSRLLRARNKIEQLIDLRKGGQIGLVAYAGDAFTVAPLTDDAHSLGDLVVALAPDTMPVDGQKADRGLRLATDLLAQAGYTRGTILLVSDDADADALTAARDAHAKGYDIDVLGLGTAIGAPLPALDGTFDKDETGAMRITRLDEDALRALAQAGGGRYAVLTTSSEDLDALDVLDPRAASGSGNVAADSVGWRDGGPFVLLVLLPLVALGFRRGWLAVALLALFALPSHRAEAGGIDGWAGLWQRSDQRADHALRAGDIATATSLAATPEQSASAAYRRGDFTAAARDWSRLDTADANYDRGNALAQLQRYPDAIAAYQRALQLDPGMTDAQANIGLVRQLQRKRQSNKQQDDQHQSAQQGRQQDRQQSDQQGQSKNQENMQQSQQQAQQQGQGSQQRQQQNQSKQGLQKDATQQARQTGSQGKDSQVQDQGQQAAPDQKKQAMADAAEKRALQEALGNAGKDEKAKRAEPVAARETQAQREQRQATEALLQRVPDDPGSLLRRKFALEYSRRQQEGDK